jgi:hypothetical protein
LTAPLDSCARRLAAVTFGGRRNHPISGSTCSGFLSRLRARFLASTVLHVLELLLIALSIALPLALRAWHWRVHGDRIEFGNDGRVRTMLGTFWYDRASSQLHVEPLGRQPATLDASGKARVIVVPDMQEAGAKEVLLSLVGVTDFDLTDLLPAYRDHDKHAVIVLEIGTRRIPVAALRQYRARDMFDSIGGNSSLRAILSGLRMYRDIDQLAEARAFEVAEVFRKQGLDI